MTTIEREREFAGKTREELVKLLMETWPEQDRSGTNHSTTDYDALGAAIRALTPEDELVTLGGDDD